MKSQLTRILTIAGFGVATACVFAAGMTAQEAPVISRTNCRRKRPARAPTRMPPTASGTACPRRRLQSSPARASWFALKVI